MIMAGACKNVAASTKVKVKVKAHYYCMGSQAWGHRYRVTVISQAEQSNHEAINRLLRVNGAKSLWLPRNILARGVHSHADSGNIEVAEPKRKQNYLERGNQGTMWLGFGCA